MTCKLTLTMNTEQADKNIFIYNVDIFKIK